jgi:membrane protein DedA with SNARE-associated domain
VQFLPLFKWLLTGSLVLYGLGKWAGEPVVRGLIRRFGRYAGLSENELDRGMSLFNRYGGAMVFFGRWIPMVRPTVSVVSGICRLSLPVFIIFTALSSAIVNERLLGRRRLPAGRKLGRNPGRL